MQKLIEQPVATQAAVPAGESIELCTPWILQPSQGFLFRAGVGMDATLAVDPVVQWDFGSTDLSSCTITLSLKRSNVPMGQLLAPTTVDITGRVLLGGGRFSYRIGRTPLAQVWLTVTAIGTDQTVYCLQSVFGEFAPQRAPSEVQDASGFGFGGYRASPDVFSVVPDRTPARPWCAGPGRTMTLQPDPYMDGGGMPDEGGSNE